ncbi:hypothetical protein DER71_12312 [Halanaerobium sp. DL-01]|uniref:hypothetical protein n=1 Tax=Halanaerobium sp. DL-01 TaxID=1653064 RepID=UPI000DF497C7|nr:hypothetical protein [Halanaerobium sp. DL-01]RCW81647.1 hypothetical protein DER71_12312 [Halanaerobium sp. DL-01]
MPSLQVRDLPEHLYQEIVQLAEADRRSITQETIVLLEKALNIEKENKKRRQKLLKKIQEETSQEQKDEEILDPVKLVREDRER